MNCYFCHNPIFKEQPESNYFECGRCLNANIDRIRHWGDGDSFYCVNFFYSIGQYSFLISIHIGENKVYVYDEDYSNPKIIFDKLPISLQDIHEKLSLYLVFL